MNRADVYALIDAERARQAQLWTDRHDWGQGDCSSTAVALPVKVAVLTEECGEVARANAVFNQPFDEAAE
jgi:NTP pyrophosphatase (non-canonical NTP hydrolase)